MVYLIYIPKHLLSFPKMYFIIKFGKEVSHHHSIIYPLPRCNHNESFLSVMIFYCCFSYFQVWCSKKKYFPSSSKTTFLWPTILYYLHYLLRQICSQNNLWQFSELTCIYVFQNCLLKYKEILCTKRYYEQRDIMYKEHKYKNLYLLIFLNVKTI